MGASHTKGSSQSLQEATYRPRFCSQGHSLWQKTCVPYLVHGKLMCG
jgi:hypothetical protein